MGHQILAGGIVAGQCAQANRERIASARPPGPVDPSIRKPAAARHRRHLVARSARPRRARDRNGSASAAPAIRRLADGSDGTITVDAARTSRPPLALDRHRRSRPPSALPAQPCVSVRARTRTGRAAIVRARPRAAAGRGSVHQAAERAARRADRPRMGPRDHSGGVTDRQRRFRRFEATSSSFPERVADVEDDTRRTT